MYGLNMDPIALALAGSALGGAIVTSLIALVTHALTGRREHRRWLLDLKYQVYVKALTSTEQYFQAMNDPHTLHLRKDQATKALEDFNSTEIAMVANKASREAFAGVISAVREFQLHSAEDLAEQEPYRARLFKQLDAATERFRDDLKIKG